MRLGGINILRTVTYVGPANTLSNELCMLCWSIITMADSQVLLIKNSKRGGSINGSTGNCHSRSCGWQED